MSANIHKQQAGVPSIEYFFYCLFSESSLNQDLVFNAFSSVKCSFIIVHNKYILVYKVALSSTLYFEKV